VISRRSFLRSSAYVSAGLAGLQLFTPASAKSNVITGFNQNWSMLPSLDTPGLIDRMRELKPQMLRYPGGTVTHSWDWRQGVITTRKPKAVHKISNVAKLAEATSTRFVFVLDVITSSIEDQIAMLMTLKKSGLAITHVELGNEVYARDKGYEVKFPTGADYGRACVAWATAVRPAFPNVKVGAVLLGRAAKGNNERLANWNAEVVASAGKAVDALVSGW
jgi:hypothetical protein